MAKLIGTAGHVDHGKTSLIKALTGIDADRLPEEKRRGMTIDVGFAHVDLAGHGKVSIVDVPGHERFIHNMLVGALGIDVALLCVAADDAVMPQTREHLLILELLPVQRLVVALTRADLADDETRELARADVEEHLAESRFAGSPIIETSATKGHGIEELKRELARALDETKGTPAGPWYLPIDRAFSVRGHGVVVTGTLAQGRVRVGDPAVLEPTGLPVRVRGIQIHGDDADESERGRRTALNLSGVRLEELERGMALGAPGALFPTQAFDAEVRWLEEAKHGMRVRVSVGAEEVIGKAFLSDQTPEIVQFRLERPIAVAMGQPVILRRYSPPDLLGGGKVTVPQAKARRKGERADAARGESLAEGILSILENEPAGVTTEEICRRLGQSPQALGNVFEDLSQAAQIGGFAGLWFDRPSFEEGVRQFLEALKSAHEHQPTSALVPRERAVQRAGLPWSGKPLDRIVSELVARGDILASGTGVRRTDFHPELPPRQRQLLDRCIAELRTAEIDVPSPMEISRRINVPPAAVGEMLKLGMQAGELMQLGDGIYYLPDQLEAIKARVREITQGKRFAAGELRESLGTSRKYIIPLLEHFDATGFTVRVGDNRIVKA